MTDSDHIIARLRGVGLGTDHELLVQHCHEAADDIMGLRAELADWQRTVRAHDATVQDLRMYAEQDACEIERLKEQLALADAVLALGPIVELTNGTGCTDAQAEEIRSAVVAYWESCGKK